MSVVYFDSSALVKLLISENGSDVAEELWDGCDAAISNRLAYPEVCAALAAAGRKNIIAPRQLSDAESAWEMYWGAMRLIELTADVQKSAGALARNSTLRGPDSIHLASALAVGLDDLVIAVWDRQLHTASITAGLRVAPTTIGR